MLCTRLSTCVHNTCSHACPHTSDDERPLPLTAVFQVSPGSHIDGSYTQRPCVAHPAALWFTLSFHLQGRNWPTGQAEGGLACSLGSLRSGVCKQKKLSFVLRVQPLRARANDGAGAHLARQRCLRKNGLLWDVVRTCVHAYMRACVHACVHAWVRAWVYLAFALRDCQRAASTRMNLL